jgi:hypothetical protein
MNYEEHKNRHEVLFNHLDELVADYLLDNNQVRIGEKTIFDLMIWAKEQSKNPSKKDYD